MTQTTRRNFSLGLLALGGTAACSNAIGSNKAPQIDAAVESTLQVMFDSYPGTQQLAKNASGMLVMPLITEAGFGLGGSFGRGALRVGDSNVDYYSAAGASAGLQLGAQQYSHVLFFMTDDALAGFRASPGWVAGANVEYAYAIKATPSPPTPPPRLIRSLPWSSHRPACASAPRLKGQNTQGLSRKKLIVCK